jgi:hypothetical protein
MKVKACWLALIASGPCAGCGDSMASFEGVTWQTERTRYHARRGDPQACEAVVSNIEQLGDAFASLMDVTPSRWEPIEYFKYFDAEDAEQGHACALGRSACAEGRKVYTTRALHQHELAHVFFAGAAGEGPPFLEEGFSVGLTCDPSANSTPSDATLESALDVSTVPGYLAAGRLVSALWFAGSPAQFFELERSLGTRKPSVDELVRQVERVYAQNVWSLWDAARTTGPGCVAIPFCGAPPLALGETTLRDACDGRTARLVSATLSPALGIQSAGTPLVLRACTFDADPSALSRLQLGGTFDPPWRTETWFVPPATDHALFPMEDDAGGAETRLRTRALSAAFMPACDLATPTPLMAGTELSIVLPLAAGDYHFALQADISTTLKLSLLGSSPSALDVSWCTACTAGEAANCENMELSLPKVVVIDEPRVLVVRVKASLEVSTLLRLVPQ